MYISQYKDIAMSNMKIYGIPASIILAQGILESGAGRGDLCIRANNHFGIKCHEGWTGNQSDTMMIRVRNVLENTMNLQSHLMIMPVFLTGRSRYASLFNLSKDYKGWANGLRRAGYIQTPNIQRSSYHILSVMIWDVMMPLLWGKTILHLKSKTQESLLLTVRIDPYEVQKEILCIPYQKNITCWLMS
jgi:hypothetical protein